MAEAQKSRVLFVCIGNACRSPMAEAIARQHASDVIEPSSAGIYPLGRLAKTTEQTLLANGYSVAELHSKALHREILQKVDLVVNLSGESLDAFGDHTAKIEDWPIADPYGEDPATYQRILEELETRVLLLAASLRSHRRTATV
jgi:arsenate reductase (thioredoxin)